MILLWTVFLVSVLFSSNTKGNVIDSLRQQIPISDDTTKVDLYLSIGRSYMFSDVDTALQYVFIADSLIRNFDNQFLDKWTGYNEIRGLIYSYFVYGFATKGNYFKAIELSYESLKFCQKTGDKELEAVSLINLADLHLLQEDT
ncbi:MAG: tetratricopeptide repeat protein, partial [Vicingaceae bacterium]|nr:tetratricopeptide repeat protein [Vicingaceae bacterium]